MTAQAGRPTLTDQQVVAATRKSNVLLIAHPGSGKTTVAAKRFGVQRYRPPKPDDHRAVVAISFTRSATTELRNRVLRVWGPEALKWPHRIVTIDTLVYELVEYLLRSGALAWPGGHTQLDVHDTWSALTPLKYGTTHPHLKLEGNMVRTTSSRTSEKGNEVPVAAFRRYIAQGVCTHDDVRDVMEAVLLRQDLAVLVRDRLSVTTRALIVDEVFDGNLVDLGLVALTIQAGVQVTLIGDPWQALYSFRGARPEDVPDLVEREGITSLPLTQSFRWRTDEQRLLAETLRAGAGVTLIEANELEDVDVVLAAEWKPLWEASDQILPLAFSGAKGTLPEAAATMLLSRLTQAAFGRNAVDLTDALRLLGFEGPDVPSDMRADLDEVLTVIADSSQPIDDAYRLLAEVISTHGGPEFPRVHWQYRKRLEHLRARLNVSGPLVVGMTCHQAKGREWDVVGVHLDHAEAGMLQIGLDEHDEKHRGLYVACTRARSATRRV